ncbi:hypothetical protein HQQ80_01485 [Microbacteriaceae bacterium VKM Ac-2855]|nr:hypothetical protein [Microbacteriaceae bacterium VKM Ac-2855]
MVAEWIVDGPGPDAQPDRTGKPVLRLRVDHGQRWPLNDHIGAKPFAPVDWHSIISDDLYDRLLAWAAFFDEHADWETGLYGSEERRKWFDQEGRRLLTELKREAGEQFDFTLHLWF